MIIEWIETNQLFFHLIMLLHCALVTLEPSKWTNELKKVVINLFFKIVRDSNDDPLDVKGLKVQCI